MLNTYKTRRDEDDKCIFFDRYHPQETWPHQDLLLV